ncbi:MAG TPA: hypothetical protein VE935_07235 [Burkholderiales bacterium]|jgi:hypothetical protein|nr:hypothetical protein [Burkholderiales bacterium]
MGANPYAPPRAAVADTGEAKHGRPVLVWVICIVFGFGVIFGVISTIALLAGRPIGGEAAARAVAYMTTLDHVYGLAMSAITAWAVVALFRLKRSALPILLAIFGLGLASVLLNSLFRPEYRALFAGPGIYSVAAGWLINLAILGYVWRLRARGVLHA